MSIPDNPFTTSVTSDWEALRDCILRKGTPRRVHHIELFLDGEVQEALCKRYHLLDDLNVDDPTFAWQSMVRVQRFLGYDYVRQGVDDLPMPLNRAVTEDTAEYRHEGGAHMSMRPRGPSRPGTNSSATRGLTRQP